MVPFIIAELNKHPRMPRQEAHTRAIDSWKTLQMTHKRPSSIEMGFQAWVDYNIRFILTGDPCEAWNTFDGISAQLAHLGAVMKMRLSHKPTTAR